MLVISFITYKGGAGKSTLAFSTAVAAKQAGENVAILDLDQQGATAAWARTRARTDMFVEATAIDDLDARIDETRRGRLHALHPRHARSNKAAPSARSAPATSASSPRGRTCSTCAPAPRPGAGSTNSASRRRSCSTNARRLRQIARIQEGARTLQDSGALLSPMISARVDFQDAARAGLGVTELHAVGHGGAAKSASCGPRSAPTCSRRRRRPRSSRRRS